VNTSTVSSHVQIHCHTIIDTAVSETIKICVLLNTHRITNAPNAHFGFL